MFTYILLDLKVIGDENLLSNIGFINYHFILLLLTISCST